MSVRIVIFTFALSSLILGSIYANSKKCTDSRCKTRSCNTAGSCICDLPDPSTISVGDRTFLGGKFCNEKMTMCDGTNSYWCEHEGACEEIVRGEKYRCNCPAGFTGERCQHSGAPCGKIFCFHQAECLVEAEGDVCECPPDWKGSVDCSLSTKKSTDYKRNSTLKGLAKKDSDSSSSTNWFVVVLGITCSMGVVAGGAFYVKKLFSNKNNAGPKFQQLSDIRTHYILGDEDDEESLVASQENQSLVPSQENHNDN